MKNNFLFNLFAILVIAISLNSCSNDDSSSNTLFESLDGSKWKATVNGYLGYVRLTNNLNKPIEIWDQEKSNNCFDYYLYGSNYPTEIIENSKNIFIVKMIYSLETYEKFSITRMGDKLNVNISGFDGPTPFSSDTVLSKTSDNVDGFTICN